MSPDLLRRILAGARGRSPATGAMDSSAAARAAFVGSFALIAMTAVVDLATGPEIIVSGVVALAPFLTATLCSVRRTLVVTGVAVPAGVALMIINHTTLAVGAGWIFALVFVSVVALFAAAAREQREERIANLTRVAEVAQRALLTPAPRVVGPVEVAARYHSASSEALIGGDLYAVTGTDHGVRLLLGDVRGKGLESVGQAAAVLSTFRELAVASPTLGTLTLAMEDRLSHYLRGEDFVTAVLAEIDGHGTARLVSCGHPPPVLIRNGSHEPVELTDYATPFGLDPDPTVQRLSLRKGDRLLFYTDGLIETRARSGAFLTLDEVLVGITEDDVEAALGATLDQIERLAGDVRDDLALLLVEFHGRPAVRPATDPRARPFP